MSKIERKEYKETKMLRTVSPVRNARGSNQSLIQLDSNLDYLLEDLQNSVSRPGSAIDQPISTTQRDTTRSVNTLDSTRSSSLSRVANVKSSNPVTEYSSDGAYTYASPDGREKVHTYKKEKYMYGTTSRSLGTNVLTEHNRMQKSINQLDSLLDDLQQVKKSSYSEKGMYKDIEPLRTIFPSPSSRTSTLSKQTKVGNVHEYPLQVVETIAPEIDSDVLEHLNPNLHPPGNTKVTTTIKTYTYEIPGSGDYPTDVNILDSTNVNTNKYVYSPNDSVTTPSKSFVYNKIENKENTIYQKQEPTWQDVKVNKSYKETIADNVNYNIQPYQKPSPPGSYTTVKETVTTRNYQPDYYHPEKFSPGPNQTYIYNETTTTKNTKKDDYTTASPQPKHDTYIINKETTNIVNKNQPPFSDRGYPVYNPPQENKNRYIVKETHTTNYENGYPRASGDVDKFNPNQPCYGKKSDQPVNIHYSYKSTNTTHNKFKGDYPPGEESESLLQFPTDETEGPPKKLDELMANIGQEPPNSSLNSGFTQHEQERAQQKKIDSLKQQHEDVDVQKKEPAQNTKNVSGPPVYYPPGHEMFVKKDEGGGAWRAEGAYQRASGKYKYEAESGEKSKMKTKTAVVPVCLPLCCGLPCALL